MKKYVKPIITQDIDIHCEGISLESGEVFVCPKQNKRYTYEADQYNWKGLKTVDNPCDTCPNAYKFIGIPKCKGSDGIAGNWQ